ncbi:MAG: hypothetical protein KQ78_01553 [Candidatus Izimaplasma bacterium HR2]|nr:MAG: hypothetical protein KQ78_01553 [Candidatus Izimaplasma bacterium HR2]
MRNSSIESYSLKTQASKFETRIEDCLKKYETQQALNLLNEVKSYYSLVVNKFIDSLINNYTDLDMYGEILGYLDQNIKDDLVSVKAKLLSLRAVNFRFDLLKKVNSSDHQINVSQENRQDVLVKVDNNITMSTVISILEDIRGINLEELNEIKNKMKEVEAIFSSKNKFHEKWDRVKGITKWILDKGVDVSIACIPFILEGTQKI